MTLTDAERAASRQRHEQLTQLEVSRTLRAYQREWFANLRQQVFENGQPYAIGGALVPHEIFEALDLPFITDVWYSGLVAARRQSAYYSDFLSRSGYHEGLSRYSALTLAVLMDEANPDKPWGGLPKPALVVTGLGDRSADVLADFSGAIRVPIEMPVLDRPLPNWWEMSRWQWEDLDQSDRIDVMLQQFKELTAAAEQVAGRKLDLDRLREIVDRVNQQEAYFDEVRTIIAESEKLPARLGEVMSQTMGIQWHRGTEWALQQARAFRDEVKQRADERQWVCPNEQYRLMYVGAGLWQNLGFFTEFEERYGAVFVRSNYLSIASDGYLRYDTRDPLRCLASRYCTMSEQMHIPGLGGAWAVWEARRHRVDGGLSLGGWWGQRMVNIALEEAGIPVLEWDVDPVDANTWDESRFRQLVSEFIEQRVA
ncbi:MAG: 2-hydroxyacyl-CoA dehydratase, partial [Chloroflexi bacterium]|nr:2-hydroxyacyl-CoA dehydratase [Chloroflexota bacterium]